MIKERHKLCCWKSSQYVIFYFNVLFSSIACASDGINNMVLPSSEGSQEVDGIELPWWQDTHQVMSRTIGSWSNNMDSFLSGKPNLGASESQLQIRLGSIFNEDINKENTTGFFELDAQLKLPNTQDRLRLVIESDGESLTPEAVRNESSEDGNVISSAFQSSFSTAVRFVKADLGADFDLGVLVDFPFNPFARLRFKQGKEYSQWQWWQKQEAFAYYSEGIGFRYGLGVGHKITKKINYGADFSAVWLDQEGLFYTRENFFLHHVINDKNQLSYQLSFLQSGDSSIEADTVLYNVQYERFIYQDWLIGQIKPQFTHESENDFEGEFSLILSMAILLGPEYLH